MRLKSPHPEPLWRAGFPGAEFSRIDPGLLWLPALGNGQPNTIPALRGRTVFLGIEIGEKQSR